MATSNISTTYHKSFQPSKIRLNRGQHDFFVRNDQGKGLGLSRYHQIVEIFIDVNSRLVCRFRTKNSDGPTYDYAVIGTLLQKEEIENNNNGSS